MFAPTRGFSTIADLRNHAKCCAADPCCHGNELSARRRVQSPTGLFRPMLFVIPPQSVQGWPKKTGATLYFPVGVSVPKSACFRGLKHSTRPRRTILLVRLTASRTASWLRPTVFASDVTGLGLDASFSEVELVLCPARSCARKTSKTCALTTTGSSSEPSNFDGFDCE